MKVSPSVKNLQPYIGPFCFKDRRLSNVRLLCKVTLTRSSYLCNPGPVRTQNPYRSFGHFDLNSLTYLIPLLPFFTLVSRSVSGLVNPGISGPFLKPTMRSTVLFSNIPKLVLSTA